MIEIADKAKCCGCTSCACACPRAAISMVSDEEGFFYPAVDMKLCIRCGICNSVCPVENKPLPNIDGMESFVLRTKVNEDLIQSTSGGFITPLATYILENNGVVCAASYDKEFRVKHTIVEKSHGGGGTTLQIL